MQIRLIRQLAIAIVSVALALGHAVSPVLAVQRTQGTQRSGSAVQPVARVDYGYDALTPGSFRSQTRLAGTPASGDNVGSAPAERVCPPRCQYDAHGRVTTSPEFVATNTGVRVASGAGGLHGEMSVVRTIAKGEKIAGIVDEVGALSYATGNEYAVVKLADGTRAIVTGGPGGITFGEGQVSRIFGHTHPFPASGVPSAADIRMLEQLGQKSSWIISRDGTIKFGAGG